MLKVSTVDMEFWGMRKDLRTRIDPFCEINENLIPEREKKQAS